MLFQNFLAFLIKSGLLFTSGLITKRAVSSLLNPPLKLTPILETHDGAIQGRIGHSRNFSEYWQFLGIPYAQAPVNSLRFQPPIPVKRWHDLKKVIYYPPACLQFDSLVLWKASGEEDCLYLNVFVNQAKAPVKKPVLVYIHGGGYFSGESAIYRPDYFMDHPIVLVTINYRLGPFGFLNFQESSDPYVRLPRGNMGLKDQRLALQWIQRNIANFGGDPERVTIMGESAGATSVHFHMLSPLSQRQTLFHKAIAISGSALCPWAFSGNPRKIALNFGKRVGCHTTENMTRLFECLMKADSRELVQTYQFGWADPFYEKDLFVPSVEVEGDFGTNDSRFLPASPQDLMQYYGNRQSERHVPLMMGISAGEGGVRAVRFQAMPELIPKLDENWDTLIGRVLLQEDPINPRVAQTLKQMYFGGNASLIAEEDLKIFIENVTRMTGDVLFYEPVHTAAVEHSKYAPTYMFYFDYKSVMLPGSNSFYRSVRPEDRDISEMKLMQALFTDWTGEHMLGQTPVQSSAGHGDELFQLFNINGLSKWFSDGDMTFSRSFVKAIVDFARDIKPLNFRGVPWPPASSGILLKAPEMLLPYMLMDSNGIGRLTEEPFYFSRLEKLNHLLARH